MMDKPWIWLAAAAATLLALVFAVLWWRERLRSSKARLGANDVFARVAALSDTEMELLDYLVRAYPGRPVLFRYPLSRMVTVRRTRRRLAAQQRLAEHTVDYVVCNRSGRPVYAFELDAFHADAEEAQRDAAEKHRVLKTAGIRVIRLKRSTRNLPSPQEFRRQLRAAALPTPEDSTLPSDDSWQPTQQIQPDPTSMPAATKSSVAQDTQPMSYTDLMGLPPASDDDENDSEL